MAEAGILDASERPELIDGVVLLRPRSGAAHIAVTNRINRALVWLVRAHVTVSVKNPLRLSSDTEPVPDIVLLRRDAPTDRIPEAADARLAVEVAVTTEALDRNVKLVRYAEAGIPEAWLVLPEKRTVETFRRPGPDGYTETALYTEADTIDALGAALNVADAFPPEAGA